jgi:MoaA/NifB/PqqE/SkfB family radical SAM enzyme
MSIVHAMRRLLHGRPARIRELPILVLMVHGGCNCRCAMCDFGTVDAREAELPLDELMRQLDAVRALGVRRVLLSGGEPLLHSGFAQLGDLLTELGVKVTLLSNGLLLGARAEEVVRTCDEVIVSLDGTESLHDSIRGVPGTYRRLADGVQALRSLAPELAISVRCVVQKSNFRQLAEIVEAARKLGLDRISFLSVDVTTAAFNHRGPLADDARDALLLDATEVTALRQSIARMRTTHRADFAARFIAESPKKLLRLADYFEAALGRRAFSAPACNAPWVSAVIETDGAVRPCFFHAPYGNLEQGGLETVLNSPAAVGFRKKLRVEEDPICRACVCPLYLRCARDVSLPSRSSTPNRSASQTQR